MEFLTKKVIILNDIVVFGSACTFYVNASNNSLGERGKAATSIGKNDETKGYKVYIPKDKVVVVTQHVQNIETQTDEQNGQLKSHLDNADRQEDSFNEGQPVVQVPPSAKKRVTKGHKGGRSGWTRERHGTRPTSKKHSTGGRAEQQDVVNAIMVQAQTVWRRSQRRPPRKMADCYD